MNEIIKPNQEIIEQNTNIEDSIFPENRGELERQISERTDGLNAENHNLHLDIAQQIVSINQNSEADTTDKTNAISQLRQLAGTATQRLEAALAALKTFKGISKLRQKDEEISQNQPSDKPQNPSTNTQNQYLRRHLRREDAEIPKPNEAYYKSEVFEYPEFSIDNKWTPDAEIEGGFDSCNIKYTVEPGQGLAYDLESAGLGHPYTLYYMREGGLEVIDFTMQTESEAGTSQLTLKDILPDGYHIFINPSLEDVSHLEKDKIIFVEGDLKSPQSVMSMLHECGHANDNKTSTDHSAEARDKLADGEELGEFDSQLIIEEERNAWAFALKKIKPFIRKEDDGQAGLTKDNIFRDIRVSLSGYQSYIRAHIEEELLKTLD